jgi:hypothetical protein
MIFFMPRSPPNAAMRDDNRLAIHDNLGLWLEFHTDRPISSLYVQVNQCRVNKQCLLVALSGRATCAEQCPLLGVKRTSS